MAGPATSSPHPQSANGSRSNRMINSNSNINSNSTMKQTLSFKKKKPRKKSSLRVFTEILFFLLLIESYFYRKLSLREFEDLEERQKEQEEMTKLVAPHIHKQNENEKRQKPMRKKLTEEEQKEANRKKKEERFEKKKEQQAFTVLKYDESDTLSSERRKSAKKLEHMGVSGDVKLSELPPWSQIVDNFGGGNDNNGNAEFDDDEPVIIGLEHCEAFRKRTDSKLIGVGPAGLFSTGTNLIHTLTTYNCLGPHDRVGMPHKFALVQVPYGKHNPADARFHHQVKLPVVQDREAILPVVAIRHPYTWMSAMCKHPYGTRWMHNREKCHESLFLKHPILRVPWGFKQYNETHNVTNTYESLAHMWKDWYKPYFLDERYNQTPRLMIRHEDMVYRPEKVVRKICECVGGTNLNKNPDWEHPEGFEYEEESANKGKGHGKLGRSGLLTAFIKYGQPLRNWYDQYNGSDRKIMKKAFQGETDPELRKIFETFKYPLFDDIDEPTEADKRRTRNRARLEQNEKEAKLMAEKKLKEDQQSN